MDEAIEPIHALSGLNVSDARFVAFDSETTGLSGASDCIVELAACAFDEDFEQRVFSALVKPPFPIPAAAARVHGITDAMVEDAPSADRVIADFLEFLTLAGAPRVLVAHNAAFDVAIVGRQAFELAGRGDAGSAAEIVLDSCMLAKALLPELPTHRLDALAAHFGVDSAPLHRALADVRALKGIFLRLLGIAADRLAAPGRGLTVGDLVDLCGGYFVFAPGNRDSGRPPLRLAPRIARLERLCGSDEKVAIVYASGEADGDVRYITPLRVRIKGMRVYLDAFCHRDGIRKTFRADRIRAVRS